MPSLTELESSLAFWKAAYNAASKGERLQWEGKSVSPRPPDVCWQEITRLERAVAQKKSRRKGHSVAYAKFVDR